MERSRSSPRPVKTPLRFLRPLAVVSRRRQRKLRGHRAFSLVEVTLALGIVAFAFVSVLGLVPVGLTNFRGAMENSIKSQILQQVASDVRQTGFLKLQEKQPLRYFDEQGTVKGTSLDPLTPEEMSQVLYEVNTVAQVPSPVLGGDLSGMATIVIEIVRNPGRKPLQIDSLGRIVEQPSQGIYVSRYFAYAASRGE